MPNKKTGARRSGNPALRAQQQITALWPFALDYFVQASRLGLYKSLPVTAGTITIPDLGTVTLDPAAPSVDSVGVTVIVDQADGWNVLISYLDDTEARTSDLLDGLTEAFVNELGARAAADYARQATKERPVLTSPTEALKLIDALDHGLNIGYRDDNPTPGI